MTFDKIIKTVNPIIIETINDLRNEGEIAILQTWLKQCENEIAFRGTGNNYSLYAEKCYIETILK